MDISQDESLIKITHYINPHMFWFKYESSFFTNKNFFELYSNIETYYHEQEKTTRKRAYKPEINEIVGVYYFPWNRWIRAKVDCSFEFSAGNSMTYMLWAIDYGIPLKVEDRFIRKLPKELAEVEIDIIKFGGIADIVPAEKIFNFVTSQNEIVKCDKWSPYSVKIINELINDAAFIRFILKAHNPHNGQLFGNLEIITHTNKIIKPEIGLLESNHAEMIYTNNEFFKIIQKIGTNKVSRWKTYDGKSNVYSQDTNHFLNFNKKLLSEIKTKEPTEDHYLQQIQQKVNDWQERNEKSYTGSVTLQSAHKNQEVEISNKIDDGIEHEIDDSVSQKLEKERQKSMTKTDENEEGFGTFNVGGSTRLERMKIYKNHIPPPPSSKCLSIKPLRDNNVCTEKTETESIQSLQQEIKEDDNKSLGAKSIKSFDSSYSEKPAITNALNALKNKRKLMLQKCNEQQQPVINGKNEERKPIENEKNEISKNVEKQIDEISNETKSVTTIMPYKNQTLTDKIIAVNKQKSQNFIPAGFDLTNLQNQTNKKSINDKLNKIRNNRKVYIQKHNETISEDNNFSDFNDASLDIKSDYSNNESFTKKIMTDSINRETIKGQWNDVKTNGFKSKKNDQKQSFESKGKHLQDYGEVCIIDNNLKKHLVLVHGGHTRPIEKLENANFCEDVHQELENMRFTQIYRIQSYTWPHLMRGNSVFVINSARTGKTMSYLPAICSLIKMKKDENSIPDGEGPVSIIIVPSSFEAEKISKICYRLFQNNSDKLSVVELYGIRKANSASIQLLNGCDILVATAPSLARLITDKIKHFDIKRLQHLVIDNIDLIHEGVQSDLNLILKKFCSFNKQNKSNLQMVITARLWHNYFYKLLKVCKNPQLCIGAYIEAAVYGRSQIKMKFVNKKSKIQIILDFLKEHPYTDERLIILCNSDEDCDDVVEVLKNLSHSVISVSSRSSADEIKLAFEWHRKQTENLSILVCTDGVLYESRVQNAQNLIHYSLPDSWSKFTFRFSVFFEYYENLIKNEKMSKPPTLSLILLDETNNSQLPKLIEFLQCHGYGGDVSEEILNLSNQIKIQREEKRIETNREFCTQLMSFGECRNINDCKYRHTLTKYDAPQSHVPTNGIIIAQVLNVVSPCHYCVRILEHYSENGTVIKQNDLNNNYARFALEFSQYFNNTNNHETHWPIKIDDLCVVKDFDMYYRAKVLDIKSRSQYASVFIVRVKLVDNGRAIICKSTSLLALPEQFQKCPFQAVNIRISGIVPYDFEQEWDSEATNAVRKWIFGEKFENKIVLKANILFSIMDTIWVDKIVVQEELKTLSCVVYGFNIKKELLGKQYATTLNIATDIIRDMAYKCGILNIKDKESNHDIENINTVGNFKINSEQIVEKTVKDDCYKMKNSKSKNYLENSILNTSQKLELLETESSVTSKDFEKFSSERARTKKRRLGSNEQNQKDKIDKNTTKIKLNPYQSRKNINERWETLRENEFSRIIVTAFYTPYQFYVQNVEDYQRFEKLYSLIDSYMESGNVRKLTEPKIGLNCLAKLDGTYNRAKISKVLCTADELEVNIFFCDSGMSSIQSLNEVYHSTDEIVKFLPFQAIRCKLTGIQPISNGIWTTEICDLMYDCVIDTCEFLYVRPIKTEEPKLDTDIRYWRYEVVMVDCTADEDIKINDRIVDEGMAYYDPDTKHFLDITFDNCKLTNYQSNNDNEQEEENWDHINTNRKFQLKSSSLDCKNVPVDDNESLVDYDIQFTQEEAMELLNNFASSTMLPLSIVEDLKNGKSVKNENKDNTEVNTLTNSGKDLTISKIRGIHEKIKKTNKPQIQNKKETKMENVKVNTTDCIPRLKNLFGKFLNVTWQQSETLIYLSIFTSDIDDYSLYVNPESLLLIAYRDQEKSSVHINFLGTICPQLTSHEIRGLNVIVRLVKSIKGISWPRLTWESDKHNWLKYNYEAIKIDDNFINKGRNFTYNINSDEILDMSSSNSTNEDDDDDGYDIDRENDIFDPLTADF